MKHAYLILAHNEFEVTKRLIEAIDDLRNDIYIHFDKKLIDLPQFKTNHANIYYLKSRVDVRWGDVSVVEAEYNLFEEASKSQYLYYHLLSGVDMPIKSQDEIHDFFSRHRGNEFIGFSQYDYAWEVERKVNYIHLFTKNFRYDGSAKGLIKKWTRAIYLRLQMLFKLKRNKTTQFKKGTQWVSVTHSFVQELLNRKTYTLEMYKHTFCADEIYKQTICWHSVFRESIYNCTDESKGSQRAIGWKNGVLYDWENKDYDTLVDSDLIFARKFNSSNMGIVNRILTYITR